MKSPEKQFQSGREVMEYYVPEYRGQQHDHSARLTPRVTGARLAEGLLADLRAALLASTSEAKEKRPKVRRLTQK